MTALVMILRKMINNRYLVLCLLVGLIISIALVSSIPMYGEGVLQRMLTKDLEEYQVTSESYPGAYKLSLYFKTETPAKDKANIYERLNRYITEDVPNRLNVPIITAVQSLALQPYEMKPADLTKADPNVSRFGKIQALSDFDRHIKLIDGRMPNKQRVNDVFEVLVTETVLEKLDTVLDTVFLMNMPQDTGLGQIKIKPVGVFTAKDPNDPYWLGTASINDQSLIVDMDLFKSFFAEQKKPLIKTSDWYYALDYRKIMAKDINAFLSRNDSIIKHANNIYDGLTVSSPINDILLKYQEQEKQANILLLILNVPVLLMLIFYIFMVAFLIIDADRDEIAVLRSRGASRGHILFQYLFEGIILAGVGFAVGPLLGLLLTKLLGISNGFLEFVNRKAIPAMLSRTAYQYALLAAVGCIVMFLVPAYFVVPAYFATKDTIVSYKQQEARYIGSSWWQSSFVDIILIAIGIFGLYLFDQFQQILAVTGVDPTDIQINPLLFFASTLFGLGTGLLFLRIYPWLIEGIYRIGRRFWTPSLYYVLIKVSRSLRQYEFLMIFLIMTITVGLFSANAARTWNRNMEDRIRYQIGTDIVITTVWEGQFVTAGSNTSSGTGSSAEPERLQYTEPPFLSYQQLPGVEHAAKVFKKQRADVEASGKIINDVQLMAVEPYEFGQTIWFRSDLLKPYHINDYLNLLAYEPSAVLISRSLSEKYSINPGDYIDISWAGADAANFVVYGIVNYWPTWNPFDQSMKRGSELRDNQPMLVVANLPYVQNNMALEPYEIWLKLKPGASSAELYNEIRERKLPVMELKDADQEIIKLKNEPMQLGMNGTMTLGFIVSLIITFLGFLLYWIISMHKRTFEFGVLRAVGISLYQVVSMLVWEQILTSGIAVIFGIIVGGITSRLFVPMLQVAYDINSQVPPFRVIAQIEDRMKIYIMIGIMFVVGLVVLGRILARIKISQAIKLGEE
ncbi:ABC transporter permease [Mahella australiensis]|uniref:Uncharacterized protein n=1 Tax=Mahella australiensis (strain DSM 15567 / CIP 107919 / 50-1 BON) TaxID=697281 RepID=F3ZW21_MAHA5|nr:ABC transporter permease [Mahella australiensis]AEE96401.1 protein of unknown function DUF214 [Mahella australiensis 50-1 BON]